MNTTDERNLEACVLALSRQKGRLPEALHSQIQAAGHQLAKDESALYELREIIEHSELKSAYESARSELQAKYDVRERSKSGLALDSINNGNFVLSLAVPILTADDFSSAAQKLVTRSDWQAQAKKASDDAKTFFSTLKETVTRLDALSVKLLKILDKDVFMLSDLAYRVDMPEEKVKPVLEELWRQNYIHPLSKTAWGNLFKQFNVFTPRQGELDTDNHYLGLTVKGYYCLHPHPLYTAITRVK